MEGLRGAERYGCGVVECRDCPNGNGSGFRGCTTVVLNTAANGNIFECEILRRRGQFSWT